MVTSAGLVYSCQSAQVLDGTAKVRQHFNERWLFCLSYPADWDRNAVIEAHHRVNAVNRCWRTTESTAWISDGRAGRQEADDIAGEYRVSAQGFEI
jgi:hypothetical protein